MTEICPESQVAKVDGFHKGFVATHLISIGAKLGLFRTLNEAKEGLAVQDLSLKLEMYEPYVDLWCKAAYAPFEHLSALRQLLRDEDFELAASFIRTKKEEVMPMPYGSWLLRSPTVEGEVGIISGAQYTQ